MPAGPPICALRASGRRISDSGCSSWPTPNTGHAESLESWERRKAQEYEKYPGKGLGSGSLEVIAQMTSWPTPGAKDGDKSVRTAEGAAKEADRKGWNNDLCTAALSSWATPAARDWKGATHEKWGANARPLNEQAALASWATPTARDHQRGVKPPRPWNTGVPLSQQVADLGQTSNGSPAATGGAGQLNPAFSLWLMGYPIEWAHCAGRVTPLSRKLAPRSCKP